MKPILPILFLVLPSCSIFPSVFSSCRQNYTVLADDDRAEIFFDGVKVGTGRATVDLYAPSGDGYLFTVKLGNRTEYHKTLCGLSSWGKVDAVGGSFLLFPLLGLLFRGAYEQYPNDAIVRIAPQAHTIQQTVGP